MSLEESMLALAKSNERLAASNEAVAEANTKAAATYEALIERINEAGGASVAQAPAAAAAEAPKRGRPPKAKEEQKAAPAPAADNDGLGGDDDDEGLGETQRTAEEVKTILKKFKDAGGAPRDIMGKFGAKAFPDLKEADFNACYAETEKALAKL